MSDLALAAFAAETGTHVVREPKERRFERFRRAFDPERFGASLAAKGLRFVGRSDAGFPPLLRELHDPPPGLFLRGSPDRGLLAQPAVAIVGARACSSYGAQVARLLGRELASAGLVVVSGLARGVDGEAHRGALEAGGATVAVLGCGVDRDYPAAHAQLARGICETGLVVSEYAPGVEPAPWRFPARNRIIAGLASATVIVEARERSGALITADLVVHDPDELLMTTPSVRLRLDLERPVPREVIEQCLEVAVHAPNGSNTQPYRFLCIDDAAGENHFVADKRACRGQAWQFQGAGTRTGGEIHAARGDLVEEGFRGGVQGGEAARLGDYPRRESELLQPRPYVGGSPTT